MALYKREKESQAPEPPTAISPLDAKNAFGGCDLELFRSGDHADVRIICENREFLAHKAVLASRSAWFQEKLTQLNQQPQQAGVLPFLQVIAHDANELELVLIFIYAGEIDPKINPDTPFIRSCVRLFDLGHEFSIAGMADFATNELGNYLSLVLKMISDQGLSRPPTVRRQDGAARTEIQDRLRANNFMSIYLAGVEAASAICHRGAHGERVREDRIRPFQMLVDFFIAGKEVLLAEPEMELFLDGHVVPAFAPTVLITERRGGARSKWMKGLIARPPAKPVGRSGLCWDCGSGLKDMKATGGVGVVNFKSREVTYRQACCAFCSKKEKNLGEFGLFKWDVFDPKKD